MSKQPYHNDTSQAERRAVLKNEHDASTFHEFAHDDGGGGGFKNQTPRHVVGSTPVPQYPAGPDWSADLTGVEPPLGMRIDEMIPAGEPHEVAKSADERIKTMRENGLLP